MRCYTVLTRILKLLYIRRGILMPFPSVREMLISYSRRYLLMIHWLTSISSKLAHAHEWFYLLYFNTHIHFPFCNPSVHQKCNSPIVESLINKGTVTEVHRNALGFSSLLSPHFFSFLAIPYPFFPFLIFFYYSLI